MKCDFEYCIDNQDFECILDEIELDSGGRCGSCIMVSLSGDVLEKLKQAKRKELGGRYKDEP